MASRPRRRGAAGTGRQSRRCSAPGSELELKARRLAQYAAEHDDWRPNGLVLAAAMVEAEAHAAYRIAIAIDPTDPIPYYHLGHTLRALGPSTADESIALFEAAVKIDPSNAATRSSLGYMLISTTGADEVARAQRRRGLKVLAKGVQIDLWAANVGTWQHPMEWLPMVPPPPPGGVRQRREPYACMLEPLERGSASMGAEAVALLPLYTVQLEGLARPHGGWRDYEVWKRCGLKAGSAKQNYPATAAQPPAGLAATCATLRKMATTARGAMIHSALFSAITPGTVLTPHCGPNNGRFVVPTPYNATANCDSNSRFSNRKQHCKSVIST